jgi:hypothetical protein
MKVGGIEFEVTVDSSGVTTATTKSVEDLERLQKKLAATDPAAKKAGEGLGNMGRKAGAAGIQIQQLVGQIQGGQNVFNALSAQAADLGIVLGAPLVGAVAGLGAAFAGVLLPSLFETENKTQDLIDKLRELAEAKILSKEESALLAQEERKRIKEKEELKKAAEAEIKEQLRLIEVMKSNLARNADSQRAYENYTQSIKEAREEIVYQRAAVKRLDDELGESNVKLDYYTSMMDGAAEQTKKQAEEVNNLVAAIQAQAEAIGKTDRELAIKAATEAGANEEQIKSINLAYDAIEAEEARAESAKKAARAQREAIKAQAEAQRNYEALLDEIFQNQKNREEEERQRKEGISSNIDTLREELMSEEQLRAEHFLTRGEQLREALEADLITKQEFDALDKERVAQHQQWIIDKERESAEARSAIEKRHQDVVRSFRNAGIQNAIGLLDVFAGESRAAAIAAIALSKGLALAQNTQNTLVAQTRALAELGPIAGPPVAAKIGAYGAINAALIAATGLAQAANLGGGASSGGLPAVNTTNNQSAQGNPNAGGTTQQNISINLAGSANYTAGDIRGLIDAINDQTGDGYNLNVSGG